jgi:hypothetical protein
MSHVFLRLVPSSFAFRARFCSGASVGMVTGKAVPTNYMVYYNITIIILVVITFYSPLGATQAIRQ